MQLGRKIKLSCHNPHRRSTTVSLETKPIYSYVVHYNGCRWCEAKSNQNKPNKQLLEQKSPKTQHTSYVYTLTLLKYFSSALHNIILSLSNDPISYTSGDYFSYLQVSLSLYTLNLRDESQKHNQQAFLVFEIIGDNELLWGRERAPCDFPFLSFLYSKGM